MPGMSFTERVWSVCARIPPGRVATYGDVAAAAGSPGAARAAGQALGRNPYAPLIPCHRVVGAGGRLTGYAGGLANKRRRLAAEGIDCPGDRLNLARYRIDPAHRPAHAGGIQSPAMSSPRHAPGSAPVPATIRRVMVAGFGPVGRVVVEGFESDGVEVTILEKNQATVDTQQDLGRTIVRSDATREPDLRRAGIDTAEALVITIPDEHEVLEACRLARRLAPDLYIVARTNYLSVGMKASSLGADRVVVEEVATAEAMRRAVFECPGRAPGENAGPDRPG